MKKLEIKKILEGTSCFIFNFIAQSYKELLKKLLGLISIFPETLQSLILYLPLNSTSVDTYFASRIQQMLFARGGESQTTILFIRHEDRKTLIN